MIKGFTAENWKLKILGHPIEDSYSFDKLEKIIAVADGVTRDPKEWLPDKSTLKGKIDFLWNYPSESPAKIAADLFCNSFPGILKSFDMKDERAIKDSFNESNKVIFDYNQIFMEDDDYLTRDLAGCVSAAAYQNKDAVYWGYIADCGIALFDEKGNLKFRTEDDGPEKYHNEIIKDERLNGLKWENPEMRRIIRSEYRNNPSEKNSYGILNGEIESMNYIRTGAIEKKPSEILMVYSDGITPIMFKKDGDVNGKFADLIRQKDFKGIENFCRKNVQYEGTLVHSSD